MTMTVKELYEELCDILEANPEVSDRPVRLATQPNYPLAFEVDTVTLDTTKGEDNAIIWIAEGGHPQNSSPYAPRHAWDGGEVYEEQDE